MAVEAMRKGALDFMRKPIREQDLLDRIQDAFKHETGIRKETVKRKKITNLHASLTLREKEIFKLVASGHANKVIGLDLGISERTVEVHRAQVMKKLDAQTLAELVKIKIYLEKMV